MLARALSTVPVRVRPRPSLLSCVLCGDLCLVYRSRPPARVSLARRRSPIINYEGDGSGRAKLGWNVELAGKRRRKDEIELRAAGWFHTFPLAPSFWVCTLLIRTRGRGRLSLSCRLGFQPYKLQLLPIAPLRQSVRISQVTQGRKTVRERARSEQAASKANDHPIQRPRTASLSSVSVSIGHRQ